MFCVIYFNNYAVCSRSWKQGLTQVPSRAGDHPMMRGTQPWLKPGLPTCIYRYANVGLHGGLPMHSAAGYLSTTQELRTEIFMHDGFIERLGWREKDKGHNTVV